MNRIQSDLEELVKTLNERCKQYGLRAKPTSLVELPFGTVFYPDTCIITGGTCNAQLSKD